MQELDLLEGWGCEADHSYADDYLLCALTEMGYGELTDAYERVKGRCRWWAHA